MLGFLPICIISPEVLSALPDDALARLEGLELIGPSPEGIFDISLMAPERIKNNTMPISPLA